MTKNNNTDFEDISYLLKRMEFPEPGRDLAYRIENAVLGNAVPFLNDMSVVHFRSPFLTFAAVGLAMFLGIASGFMTGGTASASTINAEHPYVSSSMGVTGVYSGLAQ